MIINCKPNPEIGDIKRVKKFLLYPRKCHSRIIWMERAVLEYQYSRFYNNNDNSSVEMWDLMNIYVKGDKEFEEC